MLRVEDLGSDSVCDAVWEGLERGVANNRYVTSTLPLCVRPSAAAAALTVLFGIIGMVILSRSQPKAKFSDFLEENRLIFVVLSGRFQRLERDNGVLF